jgi:hypothetical protein
MIFNYKKNDDFRIYDTETKKFSTVSKVPNDKPNYYVFDGYASDEGLVKFARHFRDWVSEIKEGIKFDYLKYKDHNGAKHGLRKFYCSKISEFEDINMTEFHWIEKCYNAGLQVLLQQGTHECYGYDIKACYLSIMGKKDLHYDIPIKAGKECIITELDFYKLKTGMYHVKITSDDKHFLFSYSSENVYTNISLYHAFQCQKNGMKINIELVQDGKPNAYIYGSRVAAAAEGVHKSHYIFNELYEKLMTLKYDYPKNKLVKFICSSMWGNLSEFTKRHLTIDQIIEKDYVCSNDKYDKNADYWIRNFTGESYELVNMKRPYKSNVSRIKPFLLSKSRAIIATVAMLYIDDVVRIHTDDIVFNKRHDDVCTAFKSYPEIIAESKTTGTIDWKNINTYYNSTADETHGKYKK